MHNLWRALALAAVPMAAASAADVTFSEVYRETGQQVLSQIKLHGRTVSVSGERYAIRIENVALIADPAAGRITLIDHDRKRYSSAPMEQYQHDRALAAEPLEAAQQASLATMKWTGVKLDMAATGPGPRMLGVETQTVGWTLTTNLEMSGTDVPGADVLRMSLRVTNECEIGKPEGWETVRRFQNLDEFAAGLPRSQSPELDEALREVAQKWAAVDGAVLRCASQSRAQIEPVGGVEFPASENSAVMETSPIAREADAALFQVPGDYTTGELEIAPQFLPALPGPP